MGTQPMMRMMTTSTGTPKRIQLCSQLGNLSPVPVLSDVVMPGVGDIQTVEDFLVSSNIMPLGSLVFVLFCVSRRSAG